MRFNVIGHLTSEIGLGIMAADLVLALHALGHEVAGFDVDPGLARKNRSQRLKSFLQSESGMYRDGVDVLVFPINVAAHWSMNWVFGTRRIAIPLWELPDVNPQWARALRRFDGVAAPSDFIYETLQAAGAECWRGPHPHYIDDVAPDRAAFGLPEDRVVFTFAFDPSSDLQRKNPSAAFEAFQRAAAPNSLLCIQVNRSAEKTKPLDEWLRDLPADRVKVIDEHLPHREAVQLLASSDVYISLHRAEGLGLGMLEAMLCGKPVIATGWSGNLSFMDEASACLVPADLRPLNGTIPAYTREIIGADSRWAEPRIDEAARLIRELAADAGRRAAIGAAAQQRAAQHQAEARRLDWIEKITDPRSAVRPRRIGQPKVLIFTPTWDDPASGKPMVRPEVADAIRAQRWVTFDWHVSSENPFPIGDFCNVLLHYQRARETFLNGKWDALLTLEHDMLLPDLDAVQRMIETPGDVIYAPYLLRHGARMLSTWQYINDRNLGMSLSNYRAELARARQAGVWRVSGAGFGCTLIYRRVLDTIEFTGPGPRDQNQCPDLRFAEACLRKSLRANARFDVPVLHYDGDSGTWLHPFVSRRNAMQKYLAQETVRAFAAGRIVKLVQGGEIELTDEEAIELARCGYIDPSTIPARLMPPPTVQASPPARKARTRRPEATA